MEPVASARPQMSLQQLHKVFSHSNPRKRAYPYESVTSLATSVENELLQHDSPQNEQNGMTLRRKRSRINEWPLKNVVESRVSPKGIRGKRQSSRGQPEKREARKRISKFQEGSLNDKPSKRPPIAFTDAEDAMERYHNNILTDEHDNVGYNEESRSTGTFGFGRFGKAVANVFSGFWKEKESAETLPNFTILDDRKAKAEEAYALRKAQGLNPMQPAATQHARHNIVNERRVEGYSNQETSSRDSGSLDTSRPHSPPKLDLSKAVERLQPPSNTASKRSVSPGSAVHVGRRSSSLHLRTPSFQSLKKVKSHIHVPSISRPTEKVPDKQPDEAKPVGLAAHGLSRQPSKRDLAKQQKLSQKVSNLESKLDAARRDLEQSLKGVPPVPERPAVHARKAFTPGGLASLPSESLLTPQTNITPIPQSNTEIYGSKLVSREIETVTSPSRQLNDELKTSCNVHLNETHKPLGPPSLRNSTSKLDIQGVEHACLVAAQAAKHRRTSSSHATSARSSVKTKAAAGVQKLQAPANSPVQAGETPPPIPPKPTTVDEDDRPRPDSPFLGRPAIPSPMKTRSKTHKRKTSASPNTSASGNKKNKTHFNIYDDELDMTLTPDSAAGNRRKSHIAKGSPAPKAVQIKAARAKAVKVSLEKKGVKQSMEKGRAEKPLPKIQKEDEFEWDEDVF